MNFKITILSLILLTILSACGDKPPKISHIIVKSDRFGVLLDSKDRKELTILEEIFHEKEEAPDAGPEFRYLVDITIGKDTVRWQYSIDGFIRNYEEINSTIYHLKDIALFNRTTNINK